MKKLIVFGLAATLAGAACASDGGVYGEPQMQTTAEDFVRVERVAVRPIAKPAPKPACGKCTKCATKVCGTPYEAVVKREFFVRETIQQYKPVVSYVPAGTYTTMRAVETPKCNKCGF